MNSWRRKLDDIMSSISDEELCQAMAEIKLPLNGRIDGVIYRFATILAPAAQARPEHMIGLIEKAVVWQAAGRFAKVVIPFRP